MIKILLILLKTLEKEIIKLLKLNELTLNNQ